MKVTGIFEVKMEPMNYSQPSENNMQAGRMALNKTFYGDLSAQSKGEMLSVITPVKGSAGYVALEQVSGTLNEKKGSFMLQHFGIMHSGEQRLILEVVPDSGTNELSGLTGSMNILVKDGQHHYVFNFELL